MRTRKQRKYSATIVDGRFHCYLWTYAYNKSDAYKVLRADGKHRGMKVRYADVKVDGGIEKAY